jgi:hypothetical protein
MQNFIYVFKYTIKILTQKLKISKLGGRKKCQLIQKLVRLWQD